MAGALIAGAIPSLLEGAAALGAGVTEVTGSAAVGQAVRGGVISQAGSAIEDAGSRAVDTIFGEGTTEYLSEKFDEAKNVTSLLFGEQKGFIPTAERVANTVTQQEVEDTCACEEPPEVEQSAQRTTRKYNIDSVNPNAGLEILRTSRYNISSDDNLTQSDFNKPIEETFVEVSQPVSDLIIQDAMYVNPRQRGKDLGCLVSLINTYALNEDVIGSQDTLKQIAQTRPQLNYLIGPTTDYLLGLKKPNDEDFLRIAQVYNGQGLSPLNVTVELNEQGYKNFTIIDETGTPQTWVGHGGYTRIPTLYGYWTGMNSRNDEFPVGVDSNGIQGTGGYVGIDFLSMCHDISYSNNNLFSKQGDYAYISRIYSLFDTFPTYEKTIATIAVKWFTGAGHMMRAIAGSENAYNISVPDQRYGGADDNDIFAKIVPEALEDIPEAEIVPTARYASLKEDFLQGVLEGFQEETLNSSVWAQPVPNARLVTEFDNLLVQIQ